MFVAHGSLQTMLADDDAARSLINVPDHTGASPLILAMELAANRRAHLQRIRANDGTPILGKNDISPSCFFRSSKRVGALLREFYVRHSSACVDALQSSLTELHYDLSDLLLLRIRVQLMSKFSNQS